MPRKNPYAGRPAPPLAQPKMDVTTPKGKAPPKRPAKGAPKGSAPADPLATESASGLTSGPPLEAAGPSEVLPTPAPACPAEEAPAGLPATGDGAPRPPLASSGTLADHVFGTDSTDQDPAASSTPSPAEAQASNLDQGPGVVFAEPPASGCKPRYYRRVIHVGAEDSPNVRLALAQKRAGKTVTHQILVPGILPYADYVKRRITWDPVKQCIGLDGRFWEGKELLLYPPLWLNRAEALARAIFGIPRRALAMGVDPGEGGADTAMAVVDEFGLLELSSKPTPDTNVIPAEILALAHRWAVPYDRIFIDTGGGGKQAGDRLRARGCNVKLVGFGESATPPPQRGMIPMKKLLSQRERKYAYKNKRAELYGELRNRLDPSFDPDQPAESNSSGGRGSFNDPSGGFAIPAEYSELRRQLSLIPLRYDQEGRLMIPPKRRRPGSNERSLEDIIGCSPDQADALVLAVYGLRFAGKVKVGAMW